MTKYLEALNMKATKLAQDYCTKYNEGAKQKELKAAKKVAQEALNQYNLELSKDQYIAWAKEGNPVELAIRSRVVPNALKFTFKADDDDVMSYVVKTDENYAINLLMLETVVGKKHFQEDRWFNAMENLMDQTVQYLNQRIGNKKPLDFQIEEASRKFKFAKGVNPLSDEGVIVALQAIIDKILFIKGEDGANIIRLTTGVDGEGRPFATEWTTIRESMTAAAGVNKVVVCNTVRFCDLIVNAMHGILTHGKSSLVAEEGYTRADLKAACEAAEKAKPAEKKATKKSAK